MFSEKRATERKLQRLQERVSSKIEAEGIELHEDDYDDLASMFEEANQSTKTLTKEHFQRVFWEQQMCYNQLKCKARMRWHPLMIRFALNLKYLSGTAYRAVR